jgi:hypothetical protein
MKTAAGLLKAFALAAALNSGLSASPDRKSGWGQTNCAYT